jgi:hypothetical protein
MPCGEPRAGACCRMQSLSSSAAYRLLTYTQPVSASEVPAGFLSIGHETARDAALRASSVGRLQRTILVHGPRGAGKGAFVEDLLALLLCADRDSAMRPCNGCRGCRDARARSHPDLVIGSPEAWREGRSTGESIVGAARRWLLESSGTPIAGDRRVVLVEGIDRANEQTQNALLKALEEPSARQMFLLVADDIGRLLPTIRSRSQALRVGAIPREQLVAWLVDQERVPADSADTLARIADGLPGRAIGYARQAPLIEWRRRTQAELLSLLSRGRSDRFGSVRDLLDQSGPMAAEQVVEVEPSGEADAPRTSGAQQRARALTIVEAWRGLARDLLVAALGRPGMAPAGQLLPEVRPAASRLQPAQLSAFLRLLDRVEEGLAQNAAPRLALEAAMLAWPQLPEEATPRRQSRR